MAVLIPALTGQFSLAKEGPIEVVRQGYVKVDFWFFLLLLGFFFLSKYLSIVFFYFVFSVW